LLLGIGIRRISTKQTSPRRFWWTEKRIGTEQTAARGRWLLLILLGRTKQPSARLLIVPEQSATLLVLRLPEQTSTCCRLVLRLPK
jgi:hypothetical protein